jgi:ADP-ribose pyrophosphatase YjhB (NUDIX family)
MTGRGHPTCQVDEFRDLIEQVIDAHAARSCERRAGRDVGHGPIAYVAAILTSMSTPPTPVPPPRREGRRFAIPTPADLRHPGSRHRPSEPGDEPEVTPEAAEELVAAPDGETPLEPETVEPGTTGEPAGPHSGIPPEPAAPAELTAAPVPPAPRTGGPTPGTLPRRGRHVDAVDVPDPAAPLPDPGSPTAGVDAELAPGRPVESRAQGEVPESEDGPRRMFPNPATLMAAGRGVRKVRPGGLRGRRLPKVEETSAGGVVLDLSSDPPAVALNARHDSRSRQLWSLPKGHVEEGETPEQAALREVFEETGLVGRIVAPLGVIDFWFVVEDKRIHKTVHHYVIEAVGGELSDEDVEVEAVEWIPFHQVVRKLAYGDERRLVEKVPQIVPGVK